MQRVKNGAFFFQTMHSMLFPRVPRGQIGSESLGKSNRIVLFISEAKFASVKQKCFCLDSKTFPCFQDEQFASAAYISRGKLGTFASAAMFPQQCFLL